MKHVMTNQFIYQAQFHFAIFTTIWLKLWPTFIYSGKVSRNNVCFVIDLLATGNQLWTLISRTVHLLKRPDVIMLYSALKRSQLWSKIHLEAYCGRMGTLKKAILINQHVTYYPCNLVIVSQVYVYVYMLRRT